MNTWQTVYEQLQEIQDKIGDKTLSLWCIFYHKPSKEKWIYDWLRYEIKNLSSNINILWHPVTLSRVIINLQKHIFETREIKVFHWNLFTNKENQPLFVWELKNANWSEAMLSDQSPETIKAIWEIVCK